MIIITERNVEIFEIEAQNYAEWRVQFRQTQTLIQKRRKRKKLFSPQGTLKFYQTGKIFSKFLTNILALEWEIIHLRCYLF